MSRAAKLTKQAIGSHVVGLPKLSRAATSFLRRHPKAARMAVAIALETAAAQYEAADDGAPSVKLTESLEPFIVRRARDSSMIGVSEAAIRLEVSRTTVYDWVKKKTLLAWKSTKRGLTIPTEQILGASKVVPGIAPVLEIIDVPELAWAFLSEDRPFADEAARPIDKLKAGEIEEVVSAAPGFGAAFT